MLTLEEARRRLLARAQVTGEEEVSLSAASGRVLADPRIVASLDVPPFANSAMDGYALRAADTPGILRIVGEVAAGAAGLPEVSGGTAVRITTGAPLPLGADTVVPLEDAGESDDAVTVPLTAPGTYVRIAGNDTPAGTEVCLPGVLGPPAIAVLASLGLAQVRVRRRPLIAILSTGDELVDPGLRLGPGQIYDSNAAALAAAIIEAGGEPQPLGRVPDTREAVEEALRAGAGSDLSGGAGRRSTFAVPSEVPPRRGRFRMSSPRSAARAGRSTRTTGPGWARPVPGGRRGRRRFSSECGRP